MNTDDGVAHEKRESHEYGRRVNPNYLHHSEVPSADFGFLAPSTFSRAGLAVRLPF